ncbi:MAG: 50S ribosomal protein L18 [Patescibacteria group bacterium]|nr:50S ribosomal protein L18 [Patescibacteria group bacterium]
MNVKKKRKKRLKRHKKVRAKISGTDKIPRLCVFRSNKYIYAQLIDDKNNKILASARDSQAKGKKTEAKKEKDKKLSKKLSIAFETGKLIAKKAKDLKVEKVVFDRGGYKYHGRVKALADGARDGGLKF